MLSRVSVDGVTYFHFVSTLWSLTILRRKNRGSCENSCNICKSCIKGNTHLRDLKTWGENWFHSLHSGSLTIFDVETTLIRVGPTVLLSWFPPEEMYSCTNMSSSIGSRCIVAFLKLSSNTISFCTSPMGIVYSLILFLSLSFHISSSHQVPFFVLIWEHFLS